MRIDTVQRQGVRIYLKVVGTPVKSLGHGTLRRVDTARLVHRPGWYGKGRFFLAIGRREADVRDEPEWKRDEVQQFRQASTRAPAWIVTVEGRRYWLYPRQSLAWRP